MKFSIIVLTYNADWKKFRATIMSILHQSSSDFEIIFADDGSSIKWHKEITALIDSVGSFDYSFVDSEKNEGTVQNLYNAVKCAKGNFIKPISPGDFLYGKNTLSDWCNFMDKKNADVYFGDAIYYNFSEGEAVILKGKNAPANLKLYKEPQKYKKLFIDYLLANDGILGASIVAKKEVLESYLEEMIGKVKYAEDYMIRMLIFEKKEIIHYSEPVIWYEYGTGISTCVNSKWEKLLHNDFDAINELILQHEAKSKLGEKYQKYLSLKSGKISRKVLKILMFPSTVYWRCKRMFLPDYTRTEGNVNYLNRLINDEGGNYAGN